MNLQRSIIFNGLQELSNALDAGRDCVVIFSANDNEHWLQCSDSGISADWPFASPPSEDQALKLCFGQGIQIEAWDPDGYVTFVPAAKEVESLIAGIDRAFTDLYGLASNYSLTYEIEDVASPSAAQPDTWEEMQAIAKQTVDALIAKLPEDLRPQALRLGYQLDTRSKDDEHLLGEYQRSANLIRLYLEAIREDCANNGTDFRREVETTYLHELGHHLGLGEDQVARLGL